jgi:hypothetical protein
VGFVLLDPSVVPEITPCFLWGSWYSTLQSYLRSPLVFRGVRVTRSLVFCVMFCGSLFVLLYFFICQLCCLSFFDVRILITPLVSSYSSSTYGFWLPPFGIFVVFFDVRILITSLWYLRTLLSPYYCKTHRNLENKHLMNILICLSFMIIAIGNIIRETMGLFQTN